MDPMQTQPMMSSPEGKKSYGPLIGIIVIVILLVLGALYVWGGKVSAPKADTSAQTSVATSPDNEAAAIQSDLGSVDVGAGDTSGLDNL